VSLGYIGKKYTLDDWTEWLDHFNLHPDSSPGEFEDGGIFFRDAGGYDILMNSSISSHPFIADLWIMEAGLLSQLEDE
jgi:hypothetical protein